MVFSYKAFISYSHAADRGFAEALQGALQRFAAPSSGPELRIFRDTSNLSVTPELWPSIEKALNESEFFLLLASEKAAESKWVSQEIQHWRAKYGAARLLLVLAEGEIVWSDPDRDFDFTRSTALPRSLAGAFAVEPLYVDFREIKPLYYDLGHPTFCDRIATIAATLHGTSKDVLFGLQVSSRIAAQATRLAVQAELSLRDGYPERGLLLSREALRLTEERGDPRVPAAESALRSALSSCGGRPLGSLSTEGVRPPITFDPTGRWLAAIQSDGRVRVYNLQNLGPQEASILQAEQGPIVCIDFSRDGSWLITQSAPPDQKSANDLTVELWDVNSGFVFRRKLMTSTGGPIRCASLSVEGMHVAAAYADGAVRVWNLGEPNRRDPVSVVENAGRVQDLTLSIAEQLLVTVSGQRPQIWRLNTRQPVAQMLGLEKSEARTFRVDLSPHGKLLMCSGDPSFLVEVGGNLPSPLLVELTSYGGSIWKHAFSPDSRWLATATGPPVYEELFQAIEPEYVVRLWDLLRLKSWELVGHQDIVCAVAITPDNNYVLSASFDRTIRRWGFTSLRRFQQVRITEQARSHSSPARPAPGGLDEHESHTAQEEFGQHLTLLGGDHGLFHCVPSPDGKWLFTSGKEADAIARLWPVRGLSLAASPIHLFKQLTPAQMAWISPTQKWFFFDALARAAGCSTEFSANRRWFRLADKEHLLLFDVRQDSGATVMQIDARGLTSVALSPDGHWLAGVAGGSVRIWDLTHLKPFVGPRRISTSGKIAATTFSQCGRWLITLADGDRVTLYNLAKTKFKEPTLALVAEGASANSASTDPTGRLMFVGGETGFARLWELCPGSEARVFMELPGHNPTGKLGKLTGIFSNDGRWLVSRNIDSFQVWDLAARIRRWEFTPAGTKIGFGVVFTADSKWLIVSTYGRLMLFDLQNSGLDQPAIELNDFRYPAISFGASGDSRWLVASDSPFEPPRGRAPLPAVRIFDLWASNLKASAVELPSLQRGATLLGISWDSQWIVTNSEDGVRVWPLGIPHLLKIVDEIVGRDFTEKERARYLVD